MAVAGSIHQIGFELAMDVVDLREFYASRLGQATRRIIVHRLRGRLHGLRGSQILGLGYATPYLDMFGDKPVSAMAMMPARQGVTHWPATGGSRSVLVDEACLPLPDASIDFALVVHGLELTDQLPDMLRELWRVLAPQGRAMFIVPNRRGLWARFDTTPFGHGRPFSRSQLTTLLRNAQFSPSGWSIAAVHAAVATPVHGQERDDPRARRVMDRAWVFRSDHGGGGQAGLCSVGDQAEEPPPGTVPVAQHVAATGTQCRRPAVLMPS
jgi:SAM-dependent methyltransferase